MYTANNYLPKISAFFGVNRYIVPFQKILKIGSIIVPLPVHAKQPGLDGRVFACTGMGGLRLFTVTPPLNPLPQGRGLGGRSRRSPDGEVASLRRYFDSRFVQCEGRLSLGARTGPFSGPLQAFSAFFCLHRSTTGTYTSTVILFGIV